MDSFVVHSSFIMDLTSALDALPSQRDAAILRSLLIDGEEPAAVAKAHDITVDNLYNIKRRTVARLSATYLHDYAAERGVL